MNGIALILNKMSFKQYTNNTQSRKLAQDKIAEETARFLAGGGKVQKLGGFGVKTGDVVSTSYSRESITTKQRLTWSIRGCLRASNTAWLYIKDGKYTCRNKEQYLDDGFQFVKSFTHIHQMKDFTPLELPA